MEPVIRNTKLETLKENLLRLNEETKTKLSNFIVNILVSGDDMTTVSAEIFERAICSNLFGIFAELCLRLTYKFGDEFRKPLLYWCKQKLFEPAPAPVADRIISAYGVNSWKHSRADTISFIGKLFKVELIDNDFVNVCLEYLQNTKDFSSVAELQSATNL